MTDSQGALEIIVTLLVMVAAYWLGRIDGYWIRAHEERSQQ